MIKSYVAIHENLISKESLPVKQSTICLGYVFDIKVDDKDGFSSMICMLEIMCYCKENNISLEDYINEMYIKHGYSLKETLNFNIKDINYKEIINNLMNNFRNKTIDFKDKSYIKKDYLDEVGDNNTNALKYTYSDGSWVMIRPSGTEPKIKIYIGTNQKSMNDSINKINSLKKEIGEIFNQ